MGMEKKKSLLGEGLTSVAAVESARSSGGVDAETRFRVSEEGPDGPYNLVFSRL